MNEPFCDFLGVTVAEDDWWELRRELEPELDMIGLTLDYDRAKETLWRPGLGELGTVKAQHIGGVRAIGFSGEICAGLRMLGRWGSVLAILASRPHRVTRLDATLDLPVDAAPVLHAAVELGRSGRIAFTRKSVKPKDVTTLLGMRPDGVVSGTAYFGTKNAEVRLCLYDKQYQRAARGMPDSGPMTRYEFRLKSGAGCTLRDAFQPREAFWHFMPDALLPTPVGVVGWLAGGSGFEFERLPPASPAERLMRRVQDSAEVIALARLATEVGPDGFELLVSQIRRVHNRPDLHRSRVRVQPAETASIDA